MNIILCGYKSCGKTITAETYAHLFKYEFIDVDELILRRFEKPIISQKLSIRDFYNKLGEQKFRQLESMVVSELVADLTKQLKSFETCDSALQHQKFIIATGGGVVLNPVSIELLKTIGKMIYLKLDKDILFERLTAEDSNNNQPDFLHNIHHYLHSRDHFYERCADYVLDISDLDPFEASALINDTINPAINFSENTHG